ncbi:MAG: hypothetical protein Unbinned4118contig1001_27 [Prokaryotic dsDNA virus sp.]|nr:MAG: hypothetical protein Unbinned4118contig1001_27 [Prokaryotic dsDNA virus sp.]
MAEQDVIKYLLKLEDQMSKNLQLTGQRADELEDSLTDLRKENQRGGKEDKNRRKSTAQLAKGFTAAAAAAAAVGAALGTMGGLAIKTSANLESFETRLGGLLGGLDQGKARVQELFELSARTPFSINGLVEAEATLEAFGVNATRVRGGVMDLAGAMGMDVTEAANAVGKALAGGAGAADQLREKGVLAMVEVTAGMSTAEMTADQFREALVKTLETNDKIAGGTAKLAQTFNGLFSTLKDQFTVFAKDVGDADLFSTAKASLVVVLELLEENKEAVSGFAASIGGGLAKSIVFVVDSFFRFVALIEQAKVGFGTMEQIIRLVAIAMAEFALSSMQSLTQIPLIGPKIQEGLGGAMEATEATIGSMNRELSNTTDAIDAAREKQQAFLEKGQEVVTRIETMATGFQKAADAAADIEPPEGSDAIMTLVGIDKKAVDQAKKAAKEAEKNAANLEKFGGSMVRMRDQFRGAAMSADANTKASEKLQFRLEDMAKKFAAAKAEAEKLGPEAVQRFQEIEAGMVASMNAIAAQIPQAQRQERGEAIGGAISAGTDALASGGLSALGAAGPVGAGIASAIGLGQQGDAAFDAAAAEKAGEIAGERQAEMQAQRDKLLAAGTSEAQLSAMGLGEDAISEAGEVTEEDIAAAEAQTDRGEAMAGVVKEAVQGVIDGIKSIIEGLPDILSELIPMLLIDLPMALIEVLPALIEKLIPVLIMDLPKALFQMVIKLIPRLLVLLFRDLPLALFNGIAKWWTTVWNAIKDFFSFSFQTGGYVPRTGMALVHQGEHVIPSNGAGSGTATAKGLQAFTGGGGKSSVTINTAVVDPDSVPALGRMLDRDLGAHGRAENDLFGQVNPFTSF